MSTKLHSRIKEAIENDTLVFFIGSGASAPLGFPTWNDLVIEILNKLSNDNPSRRNLIPVLQDNIFTAIEILEKIKSDKTDIYEIIKEKFLVNFDITDDKLNRHKKLWEITNKIITTNYDLILESANPKIIPTVYTQCFEIAQLTKKNEYLLKMHGSIEDVSECILFEENYKNLYNGDEKSVLFQLKKIFTDYTIIFLGFSLQDPYVCNIFENMNKIFDGFINKHFIFSTNEDDFSRYSTNVIKISNWEMALEEILDEMVIIKRSKSIAAKEVSVTTDNITMDTVVNTEKSKIKIALLLASPIDNPYEFSFNDLTKNFVKFDVHIDCYYFSLDTIRELEGYDYFIILSKVFKNKLCAEDEYFKSNFVTLTDLEDNIYCKNLKGIFCFINDEIELENTLSYPFIICRQDKNKMKDVIFKLFRRYDYKYITSNLKYINLDKLEPIMLCQGEANIINLKTNMSNSIDTKALAEFVGRNSDLESIIRKILVLRSKGQILTIKGSGGIGKTTIAKKCAYEFSKRGFFDQGIYFIDLEHIENFKQFEHKIAQCFELDNTINFKDYVTLNNCDKNSLIILDNFETLLYIEDNLEIQELLRFISDYSTIVLTSRETVFPNSQIEDIYTLRDFTTDEAVELFCKKYKYKIEKDEMQCLKSDIIETLLNKNPLAIKIVTSNLPKGKSIQILQQELETDFFNTLNEYTDNIYINECDENIEKSKSLYQSINYSYKKLNDKEKLAFQLLSLFPDGISMENFKLFFKTCSKNLSLNPIRDGDLKSLDNKSLVDLINGSIKLQSIIKRFAEYTFNQRSEENKILFFREAFNYNSFLLKQINKIAKTNAKLAYELFDDQSNNFFKSITYINKFEDYKMDKLYKLDYIDDFSGYSQHNNCLDRFIHEISQLEGYFDELADGTLLFDIIKINAYYYWGDFETSFKKLNQVISFTNFNCITNKNSIFKSIIADAFYLYFYEGKSFEFSKWIINNKLSRPSYYNTGVFELGKYKNIIPLNDEKDFFDFEQDFNQGKLNKEELMTYIDNVYPKDHLEKMQIHYLKSKLEKLDKETINALVVTNPYTLGLQDMMYAFIEEDNELTIEHYLNALKNLEHIKYYYVECIYYFSSFLNSINHIDYQYWVDKGYDLAKEFNYGFLIYKFEYLLNITIDVYNEDNYHLPEELNFSDYITFIKKSLNTK
ncbi:MAG: SIR2 family protein [Clostridium sp.]|uniref:SIR2 family protein n=1 Tax=Clostridium sp. TaxID=1506 RepID=UPI0025BB16B4|nr:SIR2 family protein [Clostridium sp.]MCE5221464.1 SIR2 family protein [Clostridium sp.]